MQSTHQREHAKVIEVDLTGAYGCSLAACLATYNTVLPDVVSHAARVPSQARQQAHKSHNFTNLFMALWRCGVACCYVALLHFSASNPHQLL